MRLFHYFFIDYFFNKAVEYAFFGRILPISITNVMTVLIYWNIFELCCQGFTSNDAVSTI